MIDLKDHFAREAFNDLESVFLISKSNCAFVNYKSEQSCVAAMARFHDSRFHGVRLVCRLRRGASYASTSTTQQVIPQPSTQATVPDAEESARLEPTGDTQTFPKTDQPGDERVGSQSPEKVHEKFFIVKSLTVEDLDMSVRNGIWATQAHNENALDKAYTVETLLLCINLC